MKVSEKEHLVNIFLKKFKGIKIESNLLKNEDLKKIKIHQNIVIENLTTAIDENLFFTLCNIIDQDNKYLIVTSNQAIVNLEFSLNDLKSRSKNFLLQNGILDICLVLQNERRSPTRPYLCLLVPLRLLRLRKCS